MADPAARCSRRIAVKRSRVFQRNLNRAERSELSFSPRETHITGTHGATMVMQLGMSRK